MNGPEIFYSSDYYADIGEGHVFPIKKFELARDILIAEGTVCPESVREPAPAELVDVLRVHTEDYISRLISGKLSAREVRRLGLPWSESLVRRSFLAVSGTINAALSASERAVSSNLAGGTHHSYPDRGEGFCVLNDVAIAIEKLRAERGLGKFLIVDLDVHQGDGTAFIYRNDRSVFTFSMHGEKNYPLHKESSDLDIQLGDGTGDEEYLELLEQALPRVFTHEPDLLFYLAGADPYERDKLGRLALTMDGLAARDEMVLRFARDAGVPAVTVMSGGYAQDIRDTVEIHCNTIRAVKKVYFQGPGNVVPESATA
jgi:acetoin utilization deacetylase AcuC-like enzyme